MGKESIQHREAWELLPWLVNERTSEEESRRLHKHLLSCEECRRELELQRRLCRAVASDTRIDSVPGASLQKLWGRIDALPSAITENSVAIVSRKPASRWGRNHYVLGALAAAVTIEAVGLTLLGGMMWSQTSNAPAYYRTLSAPATLNPYANVRAVFSPTLTLSELQTLLNQLDMQIVGGPSGSGVYSLRAARAGESAQTAAIRLRAQPGVRFAEPIGAASEPGS